MGRKLLVPLVLTTTLLLLASPAGVRAAPPEDQRDSRSAEAWDFNGDGYADLAVGVPREAIGALSSAGGINVIYGTARGLRATGDQFWSANSRGVKGSPQIGDYFGGSLASSDFDGDGFADLAVGAFTSGFGGSVSILYGGTSGLTRRDQYFSKSQLRVDYAYEGVLASGDFDGDSFGDLAVGTRAATPAGGTPRRGAVTLVFGSASGLRLNRLQQFSLDTPGMPGGDLSARGGFGKSLAAGDLNGDAGDDLLVGVQTEDLSGQGAYYFPGTSRGIDVGRGRFMPATSSSTTGTAFSNNLGARLAIGDFDGNGYGEAVLADYAAGPPRGCAESASCGGAVVVLPGSAAGPTPAGARVWHQDVPGIPDRTESDDYFGWSIATGDLNGDGRSDLAVGVRGEDLGSVASAGAVNVIYGSPSGLSSAGAQLWSQTTPGIKGRAEGDQFGLGGFRIADFGSGPTADLAVAVPYETFGSRRESNIYAAGLVHVLYSTRAGLTTRDQVWHQDKAGIKGKAEEADYFGFL